MGAGSSSACSCACGGPGKKKAGPALAASTADIEQAVQLFNKKPKKGIAYAFEHGLCESTPQAVASLLHEALGQKKLDKVQVGEYLGEHDDFNQQVLAAFVHGVPMADLGFDDSLRLFLSTFHLPGEAQKIDRFMEVFSGEFWRTHPGVFEKPDTPYILAFSTIMLNTDHFSSGIREDRRMTREQFISNNRAIDDALTPTYLGTIYDRICANEIKMSEMEAGDTRSVLCYTNPRKQGWLGKITPGVLMNHEEKMWFVLKDRTLYYLESPPALGVAPLLCGMLPLDYHQTYQVHCRPAGHSKQSVELYCTRGGGEAAAAAQTQNVKGLRVRYRHHEHHYVEAEERESFLFAARDAEEGSAWCEALTKALQDVKEDYIEAVEQRKRPPASAAAAATEATAAAPGEPETEVVDHAWLRSRLAGGGLESMSPHEVEGALSWLRAKLLESSGSFVHRGDVELHAAAALEAIPPSVLPGHTHSRSEQTQCALSHWMFMLQPPGLAEVQHMLEQRLGFPPCSTVPEQRAAAAEMIDGLLGPFFKACAASERQNKPGPLGTPPSPSPSPPTGAGGGAEAPVTADL